MLPAHTIVLLPLICRIVMIYQGQLVNNTELTMDDYRAYVKQKAVDGDGVIVLNRTPSHAAIVISALFSKAQSLVEIVSDGLDDTVWLAEDVAGEAVAFLRRNADARLIVVVGKPIAVAGNGLLSTIRDAGFIDRVTMFHAPEDLMAKFDVNFMVVDSKHLRFQGERAKFEAVIQFNESDRGEKLHKLFATFTSNSTAINLL